MPLLSLTAGSASAANANALYLTYHSFSYLSSHPSVNCVGTGLPGAYNGWTASDGDLANNYFADLEGCDGSGTVIKNNAGGEYNDSSVGWRVYYNSTTYCGGTWCGSYDSESAGSKNDLSVTYNEDAAVRRMA